MLKVGDVRWCDLSREEKKVFESCKEVFAWLYEKPERMKFCEAMRLYDETMALFARFSGRPYWHRRHKLAEDFWDAEGLERKLRELKKGYKEYAASAMEEKRVEMEPEKSPDRLMAETEELFRPGSKLVFLRWYREDDEIEVVVCFPLEGDVSILMSEKFLPFVLRSSPHLAEISKILERETGIGSKKVEETEFEISQLDFYDHFHPNEVAEKTLNVWSLTREEGLKVLEAVFRQIAATPRKY